MAVEVPEQFFGKFKLDKSENFEQYLASKGVSWILRKMISLSSITKIFEKSPTKPGCYNMQNLSSKQNTFYANWQLGVPFEGLGLDSTKHNITFNLLDNICLTEHHVRLENPDLQSETYYYTIENDQLVLKMENEKTSCRRFFKRIP